MQGDNIPEMRGLLSSLQFSDGDKRTFEKLREEMPGPGA